LDYTGILEIDFPYECAGCGDAWLRTPNTLCSWCEDERNDSAWATHIPWLWAMVAQAVAVAWGRRVNAWPDADWTTYCDE
jgi:hypothetical protein